MALFKADSANAGYTQCLLLGGSFVCPASPAVNQQIIPALLPLTQPRTSAAQVSCTVNPVGLRVPIFCRPVPGTAPPGTNISNLPQGLSPGGPTTGEFVLDLTAYPADIVSVTADYCAQARNTVTGSVQVSLIDTVNKLVYLQVVGFASGSPLAPAAGVLISFKVTFKDSIGV